MSHVNVREFRPVKVYAKRSGFCPACGKPTSRQRVFEHTLSPFNVNPDGTVCTLAEVRVCVQFEADGWAPDFRHKSVKCADPGDNE